MKSQKDITLKNDLDARDRLDIYRNFLLYCMSGDVVALPMGSTGALTCCPRLASEGVARFLIPGILFVFASSVSALLDGHPGRPSRSRSMKIVAVLRLKAGCWGTVANRLACIKDWLDTALVQCLCTRLADQNRHK